MSFGLSREQRAKVEGEAQAMAIERFKAKAAELAKGFGFSGYSLREVAVNSNDQGFPRPMRSMAAGGAMQAEMAVPVEAGKSTVMVTVSGSVQLRYACCPTSATSRLVWRAGVALLGCPPPSIFQATPRTLFAAGEQKNTASSPSSSGVVNCSDGSFSPSSCFVGLLVGPCRSAAALASTCFCTSGVSTQPGQIALQVTPVVAFSSAMTLVSPTRPCLAVT